MSCRHLHRWPALHISLTEHRSCFNIQDDTRSAMSMFAFFKKKYFVAPFFSSEFLRARLEELRMFLENETWELCPVKSNFNISQLHVSKNPATEASEPSRAAFTYSTRPLFSHPLRCESSIQTYGGNNEEEKKEVTDRQIQIPSCSSFHVWCSSQTTYWPDGIDLFEMILIYELGALLDK